MNKTSTLIPGLFVIEPNLFKDLRGAFVKTFHSKEMADLGLDFHFEEEFYSVSTKGVLRGMHFQIPPFDHEKMVTCLVGSVLDVLVDLRPGATYGKFFSVELNAKTPRTVFTPRGIAHGFLSLSDESLMLYKTSCIHSTEHDRGIRWDSFGFHWPNLQMYISDRDRNHPSFRDFSTPFGSIEL